MRQLTESEALSRDASTYPIVAFGEAMIELSKVEADTCAIGVGGDTFNTAVYLARSGLPVAFATTLGNDPFSEKIVNTLNTEAIHLDYISRTAQGPTGLYAIDLDSRGERSFSYWRSASAAKHFFWMENASSVLEAMSKTPLLYLSGITLAIFSTEEQTLICDLARQVRMKGGEVAFDPNYRASLWPRPDQARRAMDELSEYVSIALPSIEDEKTLYSCDRPEDAVQRWQAFGTKEILVRAGSHGAYLAGHGWSHPREVLQPIDTTGAGDSFNAAYLASRLSGNIPTMAAAAGHALASQVLMCNGAILPK